MLDASELSVADPGGVESPGEGTGSEFGGGVSGINSDGGDDPEA